MATGTCGRRAALVAGMAFVGLLVNACGATEEYQLGQPVEMGPYTFEAKHAGEGRWGSERTIDIQFRVHRDDSAPFTTTFQSVFGYQMRLYDDAGNAFWVSPDPVAPVYRAGRWRSDQYLARVRLSPSAEGVRDGERIGKDVEDFTLIVENPAPEGNQPGRVAIRLH